MLMTLIHDYIPPSKYVLYYIEAVCKFSMFASKGNNSF
jgi:hypothetical protein